MKYIFFVAALFCFSAKAEISEQSFHHVLDEVEANYKSVVEEKKRNFIIERNWESDVEGGFTSATGGDLRFILHGGLARHPDMTNDSFRIFLCRMLGLHIGGEPKGRVSAQGQANYFATNTCMKKLLNGQNNIEAVKKMEVNPIVKSDCEMVYGEGDRYAICVRSAMGSYNTVKIFWDILGKKVDLPSFATPDETVVIETNFRQPSLQCHLDTYLEAALCDNNSQPCLRSDGFDIGARPLCWYKPE